MQEIQDDRGRFAVRGKEVETGKPLTEMFHFSQVITINLEKESTVKSSKGRKRTQTKYLKP